MNCLRWLRLFGFLVVQRPFPGVIHYLHRLFVSVPLLVLIGLMQLIHTICLFLDHLLFPNFRRQEIIEPLFVLGLPRSGTTHMHRLLATDPQFTTFSTLECLFAPSILQRWFFKILKHCDARLGRPLSWLADVAEKRLARRMDDLHPTSLSAPEEDYFCLMPWFACFLLIVPFPEASWLHRIARDELDSHERNQLFCYYRQCLQRHLYFHNKNGHVSLLSKNAAFSGMAESLAHTFPDARFVILRRDPMRAIDSQFRVLHPARRLLGLDSGNNRFFDDLLDTLEAQAMALDELLSNRSSDRCREVPLSQLSREPREVIHSIYAMLGRAIPAVLEDRLATLSEAPPYKAMTVVNAPDAPSGNSEVVARFARWRSTNSVQI